MAGSNSWHMSRREFIKVTSAAAVGTLFIGWLPRRPKASGKYPLWGKVIVVRDDEATDGPNIRGEVVRAMLGEAIKRLTGESSVADAWASLLPGWREDHVIAIKVNTIAKAIPSHPEVVAAIVAGLTRMGVPENNIIVYDRKYLKNTAYSGLSVSGYTYNTGPVGVRCFETEEEGWGYDQDNPVNILGQRRTLSSILTRCDHLINVPVLKVHLDPYGVTLSLKNHYGSVDRPEALHGNFATACATLNAQKPIRNKTRLIVTDALFGFWGSRAVFVPDFAPNSIIVSVDPVAVDFVGTEMLNQERTRRNQAPREVPVLDEAVRMGLGAPADEVRKVSIYMGTDLGIICVLSASVFPTAVVAGRSSLLRVEVALDPSQETFPRKMDVDLSLLDDSSKLPLEHIGEGHYRGSTTVTPSKNGQFHLSIMLDKGKDGRACLSSVPLDVYPGGDLSIYEEGPGPGWTVEASRAESNTKSTEFVHNGRFSHAILLQTGVVPGTVRYMYDDPDGVEIFGYSHLEFYINGGEASGQDPVIAGKRLSDLGITVQADTWTLVSIPISEVSTTVGRLTSIWVQGAVKDTFYLDDMKLVAKEPPKPSTGVEVEEKVKPSGYLLSQNFPNPFNSWTEIPFALHEDTPVQLAIYNSSGQMVRMLVKGYRQAGSHKVVWDGKDESGRDVASGIYLCRLMVRGRTAGAIRMTLVR